MEADANNYYYDMTNLTKGAAHKIDWAPMGIGYRVVADGLESSPR